MTEPAAIVPARVLVVAGPTAVGKTELAVELARRLDAEIIGADSRQVYRYMDVGTAKPGRELLDEIPHHMVNVVRPDEHFDVACWRQGAVAALIDVHRRGKRAILCGGTGLYLRAIFKGLFRGPGANAELRRVFAEREQENPGWLRSQLLMRDPESAARIHPNDMVRTVRALEVLEVSGRSLPDWQRSEPAEARPFDTAVLRIDMERGALYRRIEQRVAVMVTRGLVEELRGLYAQGYAPGLRAFSAIGYREAGLFLSGALAEEDLVASISRATKRYAKRQLTWLRHQLAGHAVLAVDSGSVEPAFSWAKRYLGGW